MTTLRLGGVPEHFNLPWHLAMEEGPLGDLDLSWEDQPGGTGAMLTKLADGELDLVSILTEGTVAAIADGLPVSIVQVYVSSPLQWGVHVPADSDFADEAQLDGARIAISRHRSGSHLMAFVQAERHGWDLDDQQFVVVGGIEGARTAFADGTADLFLWDRFMTQPLVDAGEFRRVAVQETPWPSFVFAARTECLLGATTAVGRVVDAVTAAARQLHARPDVAQEIAERYGITTDGATAWLGATRFADRGAWDPEIADTTLATLARAGFG